MFLRRHVRRRSGKKHTYWALVESYRTATPRTLVEEFTKIKSGDVVLPARMADGRQQTIHLRCVTTPDNAQQVLLNRLGLTLSQRLRTVNEVEQM